MPRKKPEDVYFWQFVRRYKDEVVALHKVSTYITYKSILGRLELEFGHLRMSQLTRQHFQLYVVKRTKEVSAVSVQQDWVILSGLLRYAEDEGLIEELRRPKLPRRRRRPQSWRTLEQMRTFLQRSTGPLHVLIMILAETGCRIGEALCLQTKHLDLEKKELRIEQTVYLGVVGTPKSPASERTVALSDQLCYTLNAFRAKANPDYYIFRDPFGKPWTAAHARYLLDELADRIKLPRMGFHAFRRGNITVLSKVVKVPSTIIAQRVGHEVGKAFGTLADYIQDVDEADREYVPAIAKAFYEGDETMPPEADVNATDSNQPAAATVRWAHNVTAAYHNQTQPFIRCHCGFETGSEHTNWEQVGAEYERHLTAVATEAAA